MFLPLTQPSPTQLTKLFFITNLLLFGGQPVIAQDTAIHYNPDPTFAALSKKGTPKDIMRGGGKRGCLNLKMADTSPELKAIVPPQEGGGLSASTSPTFWIQTPYISEQLSSGETLSTISAILSIRKTDSFAAQPLQKIQIQLPMKPGIVGVKLPQAITDRGLLAWTLTVVCDAENPARNPFVSGLVMVKPNAELLKRVIKLPPKEQVIELMRSGYWYDALALIERNRDPVLQSLMGSSTWKAPE